MKSYIMVPFVFALGLLIGAWQPRAQVAQLSKNLEVAEDALERGIKGGRKGFGVTEMLGIEPTESTASSKKEDPSDSAAATNEVVAVDGEPDDELKDEKFSGLDLDAAVDAWKVRVELARSSFISNTGLDNEQIMRFDQCVDGMNLAIGSTIDFLADGMDAGADVDPEVMYRMADAMLTSVVNTYDAIDAFAPDGWREQAGGDLNLLDFVDPEVARPLVELENINLN